MTEREIAFGIAGIAIGLATCRWIYTLMYGRFHLRRCDVCKAKPRCHCNDGAGEGGKGYVLDWSSRRSR